ncbi:MAG: DUF3025 domain-containing protein [Oligoflexales bacterium]
MHKPWRAEYALTANFPVASHFAKFSDWPQIEDYNEAYRLFAGEGEVQFVEQAQLGQRATKRLRRMGLFGARYYSTNIRDRLAIPTRIKNWHDFFNVLTWITFPKSKYIIQSLVSEFAGASRRHPTADALTHIDEGCILLACEVGDLSDVLRVVEAQDIEEKARLVARGVVKPFVLGHGIFESVCDKKILQINASAIILPFDRAFFSHDVSTCFPLLDEKLAELLNRSQEGESWVRGSVPAQAVFGSAIR